MAVVSACTLGFWGPADGTAVWTAAEVAVCTPDGFSPLHTDPPVLQGSARNPGIPRNVCAHKMPINRQEWK